MVLLGFLFPLGCDTVGPDDPGGAGNRQKEEGGTDSADEGDTETQAPVCDIDVLETFDTGLPLGWTISKAGFIEGSGSGSGSAVEDDPETWHHTTVEAEGDLAPEGMEGGYLFVGGYTGMYEALYTPFYRIDDCGPVSLSFTHFFDDSPENEMDRGELWIIVDGPPWKQLGTYNEAGLHEETIDLSDYLKGGFNFQLQFQFIDEDQGNIGWALDNVALVGSL